MKMWSSTRKWQWWVSNRFGFRLRLIVAMLLLTIIIFLVLLYPDLPAERLDSSLLFLVVLAVVVLLLPWEQITSLKAAGVEITIDQAQVDRAIETVKGQGKDIADEGLRALIQRLQPQIEHAAGSRILWIDDQPYNVLGERRLLRALGIEIAIAESSETAREYLQRDGDFDLIISDVRGKEHHPPEAIRFIQEVRQSEEERRRAGNYQHIPLVPVVFYSGHDWQRYCHFLQELRSAESCVVWTSGVEQLVQEVLYLLWHGRLEPRRFVQNPDRPAPEEKRTSG